VSYVGAPAGSTYTPPPPPDPDPTPDPPSAERFGSPVTTATYTVPGTIPHTGAADASVDLVDWLNTTVPDGSIVDFAIPGANYRMDDTGLFLPARNHLDIRGHGNTTITMNGVDAETFSTFHLRGSNHIKIVDFIVHGSYSIYPDQDGEESHLLGLSGWFGARESSYVELAGIVGDHVFGDFVYAEGEDVGEQRASHHLWVHDNDFDYCGRNGFSAINLTDAWFEDNAMDHMAYHCFDVEPNQDAEEVRRIYFRRNDVGEYAARDGFIGFFFAAGSPNDAPVSNIVVQANTVAGIAANGYDATPRCLNSAARGAAAHRYQDISILDNIGSRTVAGPAVLYAEYIDNLLITGNDQPLSSSTLVGVSACTNYTIEPNP